MARRGTQPYQGRTCIAIDGPMLHLSPIRNYRRITKYGLDPTYDQRGGGRIWLAAPYRLEWAVLHLMAHHRVRELDLYHIHLPPFSLTRVREGIYYTFDPIPWDEMTHVHRYVAWD